MTNLFHKYILAILITILVMPIVNAQSTDQHLKVALRAVGNEFLLQIEDSTSRILPINKINGRYAVRFEREFSFEPDVLFFAVTKVLKEIKIIDSYIVEIETCETTMLVHSAEISFNSNVNEFACKKRLLPSDCYVFYFTVVEDKQSVKSDINSINYLYALVIFTFVIGIFFYVKSKHKKSKLDLISIGKYQFDKKGMSLLYKGESTLLSSKESDLLFLLINNESKTLEREYILNVVWGDEGNYIGRTLDVFISKLRKKLEGDSSLRIDNIRGVGYKFIIHTKK